MQLAQSCHKNVESAEYVGWEYGVPAHTNVQCAISRLVEAVRFIAVGGVDRHAVAAVLQGQRDVDDESLCASNAQVGVDDHHIGGCETRHAGRRC